MRSAGDWGAKQYLREYDVVFPLNRIALLIIEARVREKFHLHTTADILREIQRALMEKVRGESKR